MENKWDTIFDFDRYKDFLINYYAHAYDSDKYDERSKHINRRYSDDYLRNIIDNTQDFVSDLLEEMAGERKTYKDDIFHELVLPLSCGMGRFISNGCSGGWYSDRLFYVNDEEALISMYLLKEFFGNIFQIELSGKDIEYFNSDEQVGIDYFLPTFNISGPLSEFDKIYTSYILAKTDKKNALALVLKQIITKKQSKVDENI